MSIHVRTYVCVRTLRHASSLCTSVIVHVYIFTSIHYIHTPHAHSTLPVRTPDAEPADPAIFYTLALEGTRPRHPPASTKNAPLESCPEGCRGVFVRTRAHTQRERERGTEGERDGRKIGQATERRLDLHHAGPCKGLEGAADLSIYYVK